MAICILAGQSNAHAFDQGAYRPEDLEQYSRAKVESVVKDRKAKGVSTSLGFSYNVTPGQKIRTRAQVSVCSKLSEGMHNFLRVGAQTNLLNPQIMKLSERECSLRVDRKTYVFIAQTEVANHLMEDNKTKQVSGTAFLLYLGVANDQAIYLMNQFEPSETVKP